MAKTHSDATTSSTDSFQAIIDEHEVANQELYDQRDALKAQILDLKKQLNDVNAQIAQGEPDDVKKARQSAKALEMIEKGAGPRFLGGVM